MVVYEVTGKNLEMPKGKRFSTNATGVQMGDLCLCEIGEIKIVGRVVPGWIIQPGRWIRITSKVVLKSLG